MDSTFRSFVDHIPSQQREEWRTPPMLPDEHISVQCDNCRVRFEMDESFLATLICTNYRLCVVPSYAMHFECPRRMKLFDDRLSIPLCTVYNLRYAVDAPGSEGGGGLGGALTPFRSGLRKGSSKKRTSEKELKQFKPLNTSLSSMEIISCLKVYGKDMRVLFIDLRHTQNASNLANHLLHFSRPSRPDRMVNTTTAADVLKKIPFCERLSWEDEMRRLIPRERLSMWRVIDIRAEAIHADASSYPPCVVVCNGLSMADIREGTHSWQGGRFPIWVFAWKGTVLMRSGLPVSSVTAAVTHRRFEESIAGTHDSRAIARTIRLDGDLSIDKISGSFEKLHKICAVDNEARSKRYGKAWITRVNETGWLQIVAAVLQATNEAVSRLVDNEESVLLQEGEGRDASAVVSSLVQICLDKQSRRLEGLQRLLAKEWQALGHPFSRRVLSVDASPFTPVFLLFLDSLHQLIQLYPTQFEYSSSALVAIWDLVLSGAAAGLSCEDATEQWMLRRTAPLFPLESHYEPPYTLLFNNIYFMAANLLTRTGRNVPLLADIIRPPTTITNIELWHECYLRWQPDAMIDNGGGLMASWALDRTMNQRQRELGIEWRMTIGTIDQDQISSNFPYSSPNVRFSAVSNSERPSVGSIGSLATLHISRDDEEFFAPPSNSTTPTVTIHSTSVPTVHYQAPSNSITVTNSISHSASPPSVSVMNSTSHNVHPNSTTVMSTPTRNAPPPPPVPPKTFSRSYV